MGLVGDGATGLFGDALAGGFNFQQAVTAYAREDEVKGLADQLSNRIGRNVTELVDEASEDFLSEGSNFFDQTASLGNFTFKEFPT